MACFFGQRSRAFFNLVNSFDEKTAAGFFEKHSSVSVRTFAPNEVMVHATPVKYELKDFETVKQFCKEQNKEYNLFLVKT